MHTYIHAHTQIQDTQMHNNTLANIYINTEYRTQIQQYAHNMQHTEDNTENITTPVQQRTAPVQQRTTHNLNAQNNTILYT